MAKHNTTNLEELFSKPFDQVLTLSVRTRNALRACGVHTLRYLATLSRAELLLIPGIGAGGVDEIDGALTELGIAVKPHRSKEQMDESYTATMKAYHFCKIHQAIEAAGRSLESVDNDETSMWTYGVMYDVRTVRLSLDSVGRRIPRFQDGKEIK